MNGSLASAVTVNGGILGGTGSFGGLVTNGGILAPGNSIGTFTVNGNFTQNGGIYQVEVNAAGQSDRINVAGMATINGGTVQVLAQNGTYARKTTYTILNAAGGVQRRLLKRHQQLRIPDPFAHLRHQQRLSKPLPISAFAAGAQTANQYAVGAALDRANRQCHWRLRHRLECAQRPQQARRAGGAERHQRPALCRLRHDERAKRRPVHECRRPADGTGARQRRGGGQRQALAQACEIEACDGTSLWSVWASAIGGLGSVAGNGNSSTLTYNFGGAAAGIDYRLDPRFLLGFSAGYAAGNQWVDSFMGGGWTDTVSVIAYGSFTNAGFYADALAGYAYSGNQMQRQIQFPGLQRTANGSTGANQFLGPDRDRLSHRPLRAGRGERHAVCTPAGFDGDAERSLRMGRQLVEPQRGAADDQLAAHDVRRRPCGVIPPRQRAHPCARPAAGLAARVCRCWPADHGSLRRRTVQCLHCLRRDATARRGCVRLLGQHHSHRGQPVYLRYQGDMGSGTDNHALNLGLRISW